MKQNLQIKFFLLLALAMVGSSNVWAWRGARVYVKSQPTVGGYVYAGTSTGGSTGTLTEDNAEQSNLKVSEQTFTFYLYATAKTGYTFKGWNTSSSATSGTVSSPYQVGLKGNKGTSYNEYTYYAIFKANTYTVTLNANGGTSSPTSISVTYDATYSNLPTPTWANHRFDGWFTDQNGGTQVTTSTQVTITANQTLYAHWTPIYSGTFYSYAKDNGQTWITVNGTEFKGNFTQANDNTSRSYTQNDAPTFPVVCYAKANAGYTFAGWYDNESCTGTPISTSTDTWCKLTDNITATQLVTTKKYYAKFTPGVTYYATAYSEARPNVAGVGLTYISCKGNSPSSDANYTASDKRDNSTNSVTTQSASGTIKADYYAKALAGYKFGGWYSDAACTQLVGAGDANDRNHYVENIVTTATSSPGLEVTRYAKFNAVTVSAATAQTKNFTASGTQTATLVFPVANASSNSDFNEPTISGDAGWTITGWNYNNNQVSVTVSYTATAGTTTIGNHNATVTVKAKSNNFNTGNVTASVSINPTFTCNIASEYLVDNASLNLSSLWTSNGNGTITYSITSFTPSGINNAGATAPAISGSTLSLGQAGTLVLQLSQAKGTTNEAGSASKTITIKKYTPSFTWSTAPVYHNQTINNYFTTNNTATAISVKSSSDENVAYLVDGTGKNLNLKTLSKNASTTLTVTQAENYYWAAKTATTTITPTNVPNHVPFTLNETMYNALKGATSGAQAWDGGIRIGNPSGGGFNYDDKYCVIGPFAGLPDKFSCSYSCSDLATECDWRVYESADGSNWNQIVSSSSAGAASNIQLASTTRYLQFLWSGNFAGYFSNITVTELKTFATDKSALDFGENRKDIACTAQTFTFNYANVGHKVNLACNDNHFTVSPNYFNNIGGEQCGSKTITVTYNTAEVHTASGAKITISDELENSTEVTLAGNTQRKTQTLTWNAPYDADAPSIPVGKTVSNAATASTTKPITYSSDNTSVIKIVNDGASFQAIAAGTAKITATQAGDEDWLPVSETKTFTATEKIIQAISWNQSFTRLLTTTAPFSLTATVELEDPATGAHTYSKERTDLLVYTSGDSQVITVNGRTLTIVGAGKTTITATIAGDENYEGTSITTPVTVREPSTGCEDELIPTDLSGEYEFWHFSITSDMEKVVTIDRSSSSIPGTMTFQHKGQKWGANYSGNIDVYESTDNGVSYTKLGTVSPSVGTYNQSQVFNLSRNATHLKFFRDKSATGYHYIKDIEILPAQFIEASAESINFGDVTVYSVENRDLTINYANAKSDMTITNTGDASTKTTLSFSPEAINIDDCGETDNEVITLTFTPTAVGPFSTNILVNDPISGKSKTISVTANVIQSTQYITWNPSSTSIKTIEQIDLNATASSGYPVKYIVTAGTDVANFVEGNLVIYKPGSVTIKAYEPGDAKYAAAADVVKTFTISATELTVVSIPTASDIVYGQALSESTLTGGSVKDSQENAVIGEFTWKNATSVLNAGDGQAQELVFTPSANPAWYSLASTIQTTVNVAKATSIATATAETITYGQKVSESVLNNDGTDGTWAWDNAIKDDVKDAGTYNDLAIHFTPANPNYTTLDATVSLTVNKAQPTITWNGESTYAWGKIDNLFSADNGATVTMTSLDETIAKIENNQIVPVKAGKVTIQGDIAATDNYEAASTTQSITFNAPAENVFTNAAGDNDWNNPDNWTSGVAPATTEDVNVIINGEMVIDETIIVNSMTIESGASVKVIVNGDLSIHDASLARDSYGDLFIKNGGAVELSSTSSKKMMVHNFVIESSIGTDGTSTSGQISNADALAFDEGGDAYIDINLDPSGTADDSKWYGFTVPFEVEIATGIARKENDGSFKVLADKTNFDIMKYNPTKRLSSGKGWEYYHGTLQPGEFYLLAIDGTNNVYSFRKKAGAALVSDGTIALKTNGTGTNANWNAVGNPTMQQVKAEFSNKIVQVYLNGLNQYKAVSTEDANFVVGCPFFIQASTNENLTLTADNSHSAFYAPRREANVSDMFRVRFGQDAEHYSDQIFVSASEDALDQYEIGHDVAKVGVGTISAQLWVNAYSQKLCANEAVLTNNNADFALTLYAPKAGEYTVSINREKIPNDATLYLTEKGNIIWNLSASDYIVDLNKGNNTNYGLRLVQERRITTDTENVETKAQTNKMIINDNMYIFREGKIYDATGRLVK